MIEPVDTGDNSINQTDYLKLFMQELTYQDPLKPVDNREFMTQMAQFAGLQEVRKTNENLIALIGMTNSNQSLMLLQKTVKIKDGEEEGRVLNVKFSDDSPPELEINMKGGIVRKHLPEISEVSG